MFYIRLFLVITWVIITSIVMIPISLIRFRNPSNNYLFGRFFRILGPFVLGVKITYEGVEHLSEIEALGKPFVLAANHQSGADIVLFGSIFPKRCVVIGKKEVLWIPIFGPIFYALGNILLDRKNHVRAVGAMSELVARIHKDNVGVFIFPEGTRNRTGQGLLPFKKGAFHTAIEAKIPIVPVVAGLLGPVLNFKERKATSGCLTVRVLPPIRDHLDPHFAEGRSSSEAIQLLSDLTRTKMLALMPPPAKPC